MQRRILHRLVFLGVLGVLAFNQTFAEDWPQWGRDHTRNMVSPEAGIPHDVEPGEYQGRSETIDLDATHNVKWIAKLGSQAYGNPTVYKGRVLVGTNNESQTDPRYKGDRANVYCLDEDTGQLVWQLVLPKLGAGKVGDWEFLGICSSPAVVDDRVYVITNLCEVVCLDLNGMTDGNDGVTDEVKYFKLPSDTELSATDADVIWRYDMRNELGIFPHNITSSSPLVVDGAVYVTTSNGVDWSHVDIPNTHAPCLVKLDAETGELLAEEASDISSRLMHCNWSSPGFGNVGGRGMVFFAAGDGFMYGFDPEPVETEDEFGDKYTVFKEWWRCDGVPAEYRAKDGQPIKYATAPGPSEYIATPVFYNGRVYAAIGQDPEHGEGVGALTCFDASQTGETTDAGGIVWQYKDINRSISTCSIVDDLVYVADYSGIIHCLDANTGEPYWTYDTLGHIWGSTLVVDGKVYVGNEDGILTVLKAGKSDELLAEIEFPGPIYSTPIVANGVLYVATQTHLFAIEEQDE